MVDLDSAVFDPEAQTRRALAEVRVGRRTELPAMAAGPIEQCRDDRAQSVAEYGESPIAA